MENKIRNYFQQLDQSIDTLSLHSEGEITGLPSWVHTTRKITIGVTDDGEGVALKVTPSGDLEEDVIDVVEIKSNADINSIISPMSYGGGTLQSQNENSFMLMGDIVVTQTGNPLAMPAMENRSLIGFGRKKGFECSFNEQKAKEEALDLWNKRALPGDNQHKIYVREVTNILNRLQAIVKRKAFLERRVHRFINEHRDIILPRHRQCLYEHHIHFNGDLRKADYILEREQGLPPMLIELESPAHKVFTKNMELTSQVNHARNQISEWVKFIDQDPATNASGEFSFLSGPKERLIIIGRGLDHKENLIDTKFDGAIVWTYELLIEEAKHRLNEQYAAQCRMLGLKENRPF